MGKIAEEKKKTFLYFIALYIKVRPMEQDKNNFQKKLFWWVIFFSNSLYHESTCKIHKT